MWKTEVPWYLFTGGLAGASSVLAAGADLAGRPALARVARRVAAAGLGASPALLISDLGQPRRFINMLRVFRPTSPMNMGAWLLTAYGGAAGATAVLDTALPSAGVTRLAGLAAGAAGSMLTTYTGVLVADTAIPAWHDAHQELPFLFAASAAASAGAAAAMFAPGGEVGPARRLAIAGFAAEQVVASVMRRRLGPDVAAPYHMGAASRYHRAGEGLGAAGAGLLALGGRKTARRLGAALVVASAVCTRFSVYKAGFGSAEGTPESAGPVEPAATVPSFDDARRRSQESLGSTSSA
ncbi:MAG TPA: NrfD/PsrC family molybdoenzyme membrane anchor subunit [Acidimicrobiia bacterium]|nr:NrfD/PsrC family molybdoenzyme membrane anchor subunit [Acidimicrobiia bacterium]